VVILKNQVLIFAVLVVKNCSVTSGHTVSTDFSSNIDFRSFGAIK
jgi:hypothetical protein